MPCDHGNSQVPAANRPASRRARDSPVRPGLGEDPARVRRFRHLRRAGRGICRAAHRAVGNRRRPRGTPSYGLAAPRTTAVSKRISSARDPKPPAKPPDHNVYPRPGRHKGPGGRAGQASGSRSRRNPANRDTSSVQARRAHRRVTRSSVGCRRPRSVSPCTCPTPHAFPRSVIPRDFLSSRTRGLAGGPRSPRSADGRPTARCYFRPNRDGRREGQFRFFRHNRRDYARTLVFNKTCGPPRSLSRSNTRIHACLPKAIDLSGCSMSSR